MTKAERKEARQLKRALRREERQLKRAYRSDARLEKKLGKAVIKKLKKDCIRVIQEGQVMNALDPEVIAELTKLK